MKTPNKFASAIWVSFGLAVLSLVFAFSTELSKVFDPNSFLASVNANTTTTTNPTPKCGTNDDSNAGHPYYAYRNAYIEYTFNDGTFCETGKSSPSNPAFPAEGQTVKWQCKTDDDNTDPVSCSASKVGLQYSDSGKHLTKFGGSKDSGIPSTGKGSTGSVTGVNLKSLSSNALYAAYPIDPHLSSPTSKTNPDNIEPGNLNFNYLLNSYFLHVTNESNGESIDLSIIDRGPADSTNIDVSPYARNLIGITDSNDKTATVSVQLMSGSAGSSGNSSANNASSETAIQQTPNTYLVKSGDTISSIAKANGLTVSDIEQANPDIADLNSVVIGEMVFIPITNSSSPTPNTSGAPATPSVLTNSSINSSCGGLKLTWPSVLFATSYKIYRSSTSAGPYMFVSDTTTTSYSVLGNGSSYYYKISAVNSNGESGQSGFILGTETGQCANPVSDKVFTNKPTPKVSATCGGPVSLSWKTVPGASTYNVFRSTTSNGKFTQISGSAGTSYTDNPGVGSFYYKILATGTGGSSQSSISVNVKQCKADIPTTPTVTTGTCGGQINISWTPVANANTYNIFRSKTATGGYAQIAKGITASTTTYVDVSSAKNNLMVTTSQTTTVNKKKVTTKVTNPGTFFYKISATNSVGTTVQSPAASATASGVCSVSENPIQVKGFLAVVWEAVSSWFK